MERDGDLPGLVEDGAWDEAAGKQPSGPDGPAGPGNPACGAPGAGPGLARRGFRARRAYVRDRRGLAGFWSGRVSRVIQVWIDNT